MPAVTAARKRAENAQTQLIRKAGLIFWKVQALPFGVG
jgi:hypothetical protein